MVANFLENQPNKICRHLSEKALKGRVFGRDKLQNHSNEGKGKDIKEKEQEGRKENKTGKKRWLHS